MVDSRTVLSHPARVRSALTERSADLLAAIQQRHALDEAVMAAHPPYLWRAEISNNLLDSHFTHMDASTLRNYAADAQSGVAFLKGHEWRALPIGYSLDATYEEEGDKKRVIADFYTVSGLAETDDLIIRMKSGILRDVSVGFFGGRMRCDLCSEDFWDCPHFPGLRYEDKVATFTIEEARLSEVSGVFDGSTPGAMILKARQRAPEMTDEQIRQVEQRYRIHLPESKRVFVVEERKEAAMEMVKVTDLLARHGVATTELETEEQVLEVLGRELARAKALSSEAADGRQYRQDLVKEALAEGVRAYGNDFDKPTYEAMLTSAPIATIQRMKADWQKTAAAYLPQGRHSVDDDQTPPAAAAKPPSLVPASAYRG